MKYELGKYVKKIMMNHSISNIKTD